MPAPRSVLIDIHDRGLNPKVAHKSTDSSGRIKGAPTSVADAQPVEVELAPKKNVVKPVKKTELQDELKKDETETVASGEVTVDEATNEGAGSVEHKQQEEAVVETPATSRSRKRTAPSNA